MLRFHPTLAWIGSQMTLAHCFQLPTRIQTTLCTRGKYKPHTQLQWAGDMSQMLVWWWNRQKSPYNSTNHATLISNYLMLFCTCQHFKTFKKSCDVLTLKLLFEWEGTTVMAVHQCFHVSANCAKKATVQKRLRVFLHAYGCGGSRSSATIQRIMQA